MGKVPNPVKKLSPETARKIAAGEVIDRPNAIVRELLDNAIDAGASRIQVEIDGGGIDKIRIVDDGYGMTKEDLENCAKPHATSKISSETDLLSLNTLGFRGEALASIAAVTRLEITSIRKDLAYKLTAHLVSEHTVTPAHLAKGTIIQTSALFENFPARRIFLKRPAAEGNLCRQTFIEKALPWNSVAFCLLMDGKQKIDLPANQSLTERFLCALEISENEKLFSEVSGNGSGFSFTILLGDPSVHRNDKKQLYIFVNGRRVSEFSLMQAIEYGAQGYFPNGTHPIASLFLTIDSSLADFNIHPAKKEVRFKDGAVIHAAVSTAVRGFYKNISAQHLVNQIEHSKKYVFDENAQTTFSADTNLSYNKSSARKNHFTAPQKISHSQQFERNHSLFTEKSSYQSNPTVSPNFSIQQKNQQDDCKESLHVSYKGTVLGVFLVVEKNDTLFLLDQHACHERILFNRFLKNIGQRQALLFPYVIETQSQSDDEYLENLQESLKNAGFEMQNKKNGRWEINTVPIKWIGSEEDLTHDLLEKRIQPQELTYALAAQTACRGAVMDGTVLDNATAIQLVNDTFALADTTCPHGRPLWTTISKQELYKRVRRIE